MKNNFYLGILLCFVLALLALYLGKIFPIIGGPVFGITMGIILCAIIPTKTALISIGSGFSGKKILQYSIILLGFEMNIRDIIAIGLNSLWIMIFTLFSTFFTAWIIAKLLKIDFITGTLIGVGTAICGGSAIAATAPVIKANNQEISYAIATIFLFNIIAVFFFPALGHLLNLNDETFGIWAGTAINDTSSVLAAAYSYSDESGALATIVKLTRTLMIIPITFFLSIYMAKYRCNDNSDNGYQFKLSSAVPYFIIGFIIAAIINSLEFLPATITRFLAEFGKFLIIVAMVGIGLNTNISALIKNGIKPIIMGAVCWVILSIISLMILYLMGYA